MLFASKSRCDALDDEVRQLREKAEGAANAARAERAKLEKRSAAGLRDAQAFLMENAALSQSQSPEFIELYSDRAIIRTRTVGHANDTAFESRAFKAWSRELLML